MLEVEGGRKGGRKQIGDGDEVEEKWIDGMLTTDA
jgi:hypothetical protein